MGKSMTAASWLLVSSVTISAVFLVLLPYNLWRLSRCSTKVRSSWHGKSKIAACALYAALQLALLIHATQSSSSAPFYIIFEALLNLPASLGLIWLSTLAHQRSIRPSNLITIYLLTKFCLCSLSALTTENFGDILQTFVLPCSTLILLSLEIYNKTAILYGTYECEPPEATTSFLGNVLFWWINPILARGYKRSLSEDDIPSLDHSASSESLRQSILRVWNQRAKPEHRATLPLVLFRCLYWPFMSAIVPRIFVIISRFYQPLLISRAILFVLSPPTQNDHLDGYWIIAAAAATYIGMALSTSVYQHRLNRLQIMTRGALTGLLCSHILEARGDEAEDGQAVTLMSNDISNVQNSGTMVHETWGQASEVVLGTFLLARQVGWLWPVPLIFIFFCSRVSRYVAVNLKAEQGKWNTANQQRISVTSSTLGAMKNIKMLGMQQPVADHIEDLRRQEMNAAKGVRWLMVAYNASANALGMFAPVLTIVLFVILAGMRGQTLDVETAFTTIAILAMITHPANMVMTIVPRAVVSFSSFERIQAYLVSEQSLQGSVRATSTPITNAPPGSDIAISLNNINITPVGSSKPVLQNINAKVLRGSITIVTGPVGSGKTMLSRAILGETRIVSGSVCVHSNHAAYCSQVPWLPNETIRDIILGPQCDKDLDWAWYQTIIQSCCLKSDLEILPDGDLTAVGSKGLNLSGGQRQRVALARAVYSRGDIIVLDDSFSALDNQTELQIVNNLLGLEGILRKLGSTVVWISHAMQHFHLADEILLLADGVVKERGPWSQLRKDDQQFLELIHAQDKAAQLVDTAQRYQTLANRESTTGVPEKDQRRKTGDLSLYSYYFRAAKPFNITLLIVTCALCSFFMTIPSYWLKLWTESSQPYTIFYTSGYTAILLAAWLSTNGIMSSTLLLVAPASGLVLHSRLLWTIVNAPLSYFSATDTGSILNHFGSDLQLVDKALAQALAALSTQVFKLLVQITLLLLSQPLIALTLPPSLLVVYIVQDVYLRTSRQLRILELSSRAAVLSSLSEMIAGACTIRAFGWQPHTILRASCALDGSQRPLYLLLCLQRWLNVVLDLLVAAVAVAVVAVAVQLRGSTTGAEVGVALNIILVTNTTLLKLVANWTDLEISLGAVARLRDVERNTAAEEGLGAPAHALPDNWKFRGAIHFSSVTASYKGSSAVHALTNLSLVIEAGQTVVVCGRTGSGKSSLLLSLLRLLDLTKGTISIDGVAIASLSRSSARERIFITVAQEAFFLPQCSLRFNLDPEDRAETAVIVDALRRVELWEQLCAAKRQDDGDEAVLSMPMASLPTLSTGQTQLLALARALLRRHVLSNISPATYTDLGPIKPIILLDEVTSSLDPVTEEKIYEIIWKEFVDGGHTVIMVAHKLAGIKGKLRTGQDMMVWMREGTVERIESAGEEMSA